MQASEGGSSAGAARGARAWPATAIRVAVAATALSLWVYVPYRYVTRPPHFEGVLGSTYAVLFPLAGLLAMAGLVAAWRPELLAKLDHGAAGLPRRVLGAYGGAWLLMGLMCLSWLSALAAAEPLRGAFAFVHMTAQHVFLGLSAVGAAWRPELAAAILLGRLAPDPAPSTASPFRSVTP